MTPWINAITRVMALCCVLPAFAVYADSSVDVRFVLEGGADVPIKLQLKTGPLNKEIVKVLPDVHPGPATLDFSGLETNRYYLFLSAPGYASRWVSVTVQTNGVSLIPTQPDVTLYRKRYVVVRYAVNTAGKRDLYGTEMDEGRCAVTHWGMVPHFGGDWQVWQKTERELFGAEPWLDFHRYGPSFGFAPVPAGASFEGLNEAPQDDQYQTRSVPATPGLLLFCRVNGNGPQDRCYGKLLVEDVTETLPAGVRVIKSSHDE